MLVYLGFNVYYQEDDIDPTVLLGSCTSLESAKYLLEHCVSLIINKVTTLSDGVQTSR